MSLSTVSSNKVFDECIDPTVVIHSIFAARGFLVVVPFYY